MTSVALEKANSALASISRLRAQLATLSTFEEIGEASARLKAFEVYAQARNSRELTDNAIEARCWIDRRAGQIALARIQELKESGAPTRYRRPDDRRGVSESAGEPSATWETIRQEAEINAQDVQRWRLLASVQEAVLGKTIHEIKTERELTIQGVMRLVQDRTTKKVEEGIWMLPWGAYEVRMKKSPSVGTIRVKVNGDLQAARSRLALERENARRIVSMPKRATPDLRAAYSELRRCFSHIDGSLNKLNAEARKSAKETITVLHWAEDKLVETMKHEGV